MPSSKPRAPVATDPPAKVAAAVEATIRAVAPRLKRVVKYGAPTYQGRGDVITIGVWTNFVAVGFWNGARLASKHRMLEGPAKTSKVAKLRRKSEAGSPAFKALIKDAVNLDITNPVHEMRRSSTSNAIHAPAPKPGGRLRPKIRGPEASSPASTQIDVMAQDLPEWQRVKFSRLRELIKEVDPHIVEEIKWRKPSNPDGAPVWSHDGILCVGNVWKDHVRLTFANGGLLPDPKGVFNAALNGRYMRALDLREGDEINEGAVKALLRAALAFNKKSVEAKTP
jgi:hypothetical protein